MKRIGALVARRPIATVIVAFLAGAFLAAGGGKMFTVLLSLAIMLAIPATPVIVGLYLLGKHRASQRRFEQTYVPAAYAVPVGGEATEGNEYPPARPLG